MLRRNLIIIAIMSAVLIFTGNAFGQITKLTIRQSKLMQKPKTTTKQIGADMMEGTNIRRKQPRKPQSSGWATFPWGYKANANPNARKARRNKGRF